MVAERYKKGQRGEKCREEKEAGGSTEVGENEKGEGGSVYW